MGRAVYVPGTLTTLACAIFLLRASARVRMRLLLWSGICFAKLTVSNALMFVDLVIAKHVDLYRWRLGTAAAAMLLLLYGLIWEKD